MSHGSGTDRRCIAVVGSGIAGLSAAWLLSQRHDVTLFEAASWVGGHSHTVDTATGPVDMGFIVYNEQTYPNLTALLRYLDVPTQASDMSFAVSLDGGRLEYAGTSPDGLFAQRRNLVSPRFWSMLRDLLRFYRTARRDLPALGDVTLAEYLAHNRYGRAFIDDHLLPMAAAIWSTPTARIGDYPAASFIRFCENHGLLKLVARPVWRTVGGGSRSYVDRLLTEFSGRLVKNEPVRAIRRLGDCVTVETDQERHRFADVVIATHADQALRLLADPTQEETARLGAFAYSRAKVVLHDDPALMPKRRKVWASWNYLADTACGGAALSVTYWMNRLQALPDHRPLFVTLDPVTEPRPGSVIQEQVFEHPRFDRAAMHAQRQLWNLQGRHRTWFCGAYFGSGFHEDGLQAGLAVAEQLGGVRRPWNVPDESGRIVLGKSRTAPAAAEAL